MPKSGLSEDPAPFSPPGNVARAQLRIGVGGRVVIPAEMRAALGVKPGDTLIAHVINGELTLMSQKTALRRAQEMVRRFVPEGVSLVDELIAERRAEAAREERN